MATKKVVIEIRVPLVLLDADDILQYAWQELQVPGLELDIEKPPKIIHALMKKGEQVVIVFGVVEDGAEVDLQNHPLVLGVITDPKQCAFFASDDFTGN